MAVSSLQLYQLHVEAEHRVGWDDPRMPHGAICIVRRTDQLGPLPHAHLGHTFVPSFDHFSLANAELEGLATIPGGVKLLSIFQCPCVVYYDCLPSLGERLPCKTKQPIRAGRDPASDYSSATPETKTPRMPTNPRMCLMQL